MIERAGYSSGCVASIGVEANIGKCFWWVLNPGAKTGRVLMFE